MGKQNVVDTQSGILFSLRNEGNSDTWMKVDDITLNEISKSEKDYYSMIPIVRGT